MSEKQSPVNICHFAISLWWWLVSLCAEVGHMLLLKVCCHSTLWKRRVSIYRSLFGLVNWVRLIWLCGYVGWSLLQMHKQDSKLKRERHSLYVSERWPSHSTTYVCEQHCNGQICVGNKQIRCSDIFNQYYQCLIQPCNEAWDIVTFFSFFSSRTTFKCNTKNIIWAS